MRRVFDLIEKLQQKPKAHRKRIAASTAMVVTSLVFVVWLSVVSRGFFSGTAPVEPETQAATPLSSLKKDLSSTYSAIKEQVGTLRNIATTGTISTSTSFETSTSSDFALPLRSDSPGTSESSATTSTSSEMSGSSNAATTSGSEAEASPESQDESGAAATSNQQ